MKKSIQLIVITFILGSCISPLPITRLTPSTIENRDYWNMGQQFVYTNDKDVWFDCAFNRKEDDKLIFDVKINNQSDSLILVDPSEFNQQVYINDSILFAERKADDPENILLMLQINENKAAAESQNAAIAGICSALLFTGAAVAVAASNTSDEKKEDAYKTIAVTNEMVQTTTANAAIDANVRAGNNWTTRRSLAETFLRKTTLPAGHYIDGEVHFPYFPKAKWYRLVFASGKLKADFLFKQQIIYPGSVRVQNN